MCIRDSYTYLVVDGTENCIKALRDIQAGKLGKCFIEMSACSGSCVAGPGMEKSHRAPVREYIAVQSYAGREDFPIQMPQPGELHKELLSEPNKKPIPGSTAIEEILRQMGKMCIRDRRHHGHWNFA